VTASAELRERLDAMCRHTQGTMPLIVVLPRAEMADAAAYLKGRRWAAMIELEAKEGSKP
jgi:hypothetical protein